MLVDRRTFVARKGRYEQALGLLAELRAKGSDVGTLRVYACEIGPFDTIAWEWEAESVDAFERTIDAFAAANDAWFADWYARWTDATETGGRREIWRLVE